VPKVLIAWTLALLCAAPVQAVDVLAEGRRLEASGDLEGAVREYEGALRRSPAGSTVRADALMALAGVELDLGRYKAVRAHAHEAAPIFASQSDRSSEANALNRAGLGALYEGDYGSAGADFQSAIELSAAVSDLEGEAEQVGNLANVHFFRGSYGEAARLYDRALAITTRGNSAAWTDRRRRILKVNQATLLQRLGRNEQALTIYSELSASRTALPASEQAQLLINQGVLYRRLGDPIKALETYDRARTLFATERSADGELGALNNQGIVLALDLERLADAEHAFTQALVRATETGNRREILHARLYRGETRLRASRPIEAAADFEAALELARDLQTPEELWKAQYGLGRTVRGTSEAGEYFTASIATIESIRETIAVPSLRPDFFSDKRVVYDALLAERIKNGDATEFFDLLERSHSREWRDRLRLPPHVTLAAVQHSLPPGVLLLDCWESSIGAAVVAVTHDRAATFRVLPIAEDARSLIDLLSKGPAQDWRARAARLGQLLPPSEWFDNIEHVVVVPDGVTALVPFEILPAGDRLLVERAAVSYTPTAATLLRRGADGSLRPPWSVQIEAFGDPVFADAVLDGVDELRSGLAGTRAEIEGVAAELGGGARLHLGSDDRKVYLTERRWRPPLLHLATHARSDTTTLEQSRILFSPSRPGGRDADYLFLRETYDLALSDVELAVLSACDTERGPLVRGEGVHSFSRALLASGVRTTVTTLWRVADQPTADLMRVFYFHLQRGAPRDEALRRAKLRLIQSGTALVDPHYWAAFVMNGDALRPVPRAVRWRTVILAAASAALVFGAAAALMRSVARRLSRERSAPR